MQHLVLAIRGGKARDARVCRLTTAVWRLHAAWAVGLIVGLLLLAPALSAGASEAIAWNEVSVEAIRSNVNLLSNPSFEKVDAQGIPQGWVWDRRNTDATCSADPAVARHGNRSIKLASNTPFGAHVYGSLWLSKPVRLTEGKTYTLSASVKSTSAGAVQLIGGGDWQIRAAVPATNGQWHRIARTFVAGEKDCDFVARINVEAPTSAAWIDDVKLEEGDAPTVDPADGDDKDAKTLLDVDSLETVIQGDGPFCVVYTLIAPQPVTGTLETVLGTGRSVRRPVQVSAGVWRLLQHGDAASADDALRTMTTRLVCEEKELARADAHIRFYSPGNVLERVKMLSGNAPSFKSDLETLAARGQDTAYPRITCAVLENFVGYATEDVRRGEIQRAAEQVGDLEAMAARLGKQLQQALADQRRFAAVPRWSGEERAVIQGGSFLAPVRFADGSTGRQPVFFTGFGHFGQVVADMEKWSGYGTNIIQIEFGPNSVFPTEGQVSDAPMRAMLQTLDRAQKSGVAVCLLISPHYFPQWAKEKWPHLCKRREGFLQYCLHAPEGRELLRRFVATAIEPLKDHPALHSICLSNEPVNVEEPCEYARTQWYAWLEKRHGDIAALNAIYGSQYASFADVPLPAASHSDGSRPLWMDFVRFNQEFFADWHKMLADAVHAVAPKLPVHAKAMTWTMLNATDVKYGVDATLFARFSDINGNDSINFYNFDDGEFAQGWTLNTMSHDLQRSVLSAPVFNTENHLIVDRETRRIPAEHIRAALWQAAVHGQCATTIWVWERSFDPKSDTAGSIMHRPDCTEAVGVVNCDLNRAAKEVTALQETPPQVLLLQSSTASVWDWDHYNDCLGKLYAALSFTGLKIGFVSERQLEAGEIPKAPVLFVSDICHLSQAAMANLQKFQGRIIFVGDRDLLTHDEYGRAAKQTLSGERIPFTHASSARALHAPLLEKLAAWNLRPAVQVRGVDQSPAWGVEWRIAETPQGRIVNLCNYLKTPSTVELTCGGRRLTAQDVLSGERLEGPITLTPLEVRLVLLSDAETGGAPIEASPAGGR